MKHFDLHCDTPFRMYRENLPFESGLLDCSVSSLCEFDDAAQICAVWSDKNKSSQENYEEFFEICDNFFGEIEKTSDKACLCKHKEDLDTEKVKLILGVEGSSLLGDDITRLKILYDRGVRVLTLMWAGEICAGGGHDTEKGLTDFGKETVKECEKLGIIIDVSHMSQKSFWDTVTITNRPFIASHSNSSHICPHTRNLNDIQFRTICERGGLVGINLYPPFISPIFKTSFDADECLDHLIKHILHFLSLGGEKALCLGADRDGFDTICGYSKLEYVGKLYEKLTACGVKDKIIKDIFFGNAKNFFKTHLPSEKGI